MTTEESDTSVSSKDLELLDNTLEKSLSPSQRIIEEVKKSVLYSRTITAQQLGSITDYIMKYIGNNKSNEIII